MSIKEMPFVTVEQVNALRAEALRVEQVMEELAWALWSFMDGTHDHDIQAETGLPDDQCDRIADARHLAMQMAAARSWQ